MNGAFAQIQNDLTSEQMGLLGRYAALVMDINKITNLTGAKTKEEFLNSHVFDSVLALKEFLRAYNYPAGRCLYDVGSGNGLPGVVIAILETRWRVTLVERREKKARALREIVQSLCLGHRVNVVCETFERISRRDWSRESLVWMRGVLPGAKLMKYLSDNFETKNFGQLILMKGPAWPNEKAEALSARGIKKQWLSALQCADEIEYSNEHLGKRYLVVLSPA